MDIIPTGSLYLDIALGIGGIPRGHITEIYGPPSSGKTTLALHITAQAQHRGLVCVYMDVENGLHPSYATSCGVKAQNMYLACPKNGNEALDISYAMLKSRHIDLVVIDTLAALTSIDELEAQIGRGRYGELNLLLSPHLRKINRVCRQTGGTLLCTNQLRTRIKRGYGTPETTPGGLSIKFYAAVRIALSIMGQMELGGQMGGIRLKARVNKNRFSVTKRSAIMEIVYNRGISKERDLISLGVKYKLVTKHGSHYHYQGHSLGQGQREAEEFLRAQGNIAQALERDIRLSTSTPGTSSLSL